MWLGHDLYWWGAIAGLAGFFVGVVALAMMIWVTFVEPARAKFQNWWAERSISSLEKRIAQLRNRLNRYESSYPLTSETEELIARCLHALLWAAALTMLEIDVAVITSSTALKILISTFPHAATSQQLMSNRAYFEILFGVVLNVGFCLLLAVTALRVTGFIHERGPTNRRTLGRSIAALENKLSVKTVK